MAGCAALGLTLALEAPPEFWVRLLLFTGVLLIVISLLVIVRRSRAQAMSLTAAERAERARQVQGVHRDLERLMVEIEQMAKRLGDQLDAKALRLEQLLAQAEQRVQQLQSSLRQTEEEEPAAGPLNAASAVTSPPDDDPLTRSVCALADQGLTSLQIAQRLGEHAGKVELILALRSVR